MLACGVRDAHDEFVGAGAKSLGQRDGPSPRALRLQGGGRSAARLERGESAAARELGAPGALAPDNGEFDGRDAAVVVGGAVHGHRPAVVSDDHGDLRCRSVVGKVFLPRCAYPLGRWLRADWAAGLDFEADDRNAIAPGTDIAILRSVA